VYAVTLFGALASYSARAVLLFGARWIVFLGALGRYSARWDVSRALDRGMVNA